MKSWWSRLRVQQKLWIILIVCLLPVLVALAVHLTMLDRTVMLAERVAGLEPQDVRRVGRQFRDLIESKQPLIERIRQGYTEGRFGLTPIKKARLHSDLLAAGHRRHDPPQAASSHSEAGEQMAPTGM